VSSTPAVGDWGLVIGDWWLGSGDNGRPLLSQSPTPNPYLNAFPTVPQEKLLAYATQQETLPLKITLKDSDLHCAKPNLAHFVDVDSLACSGICFARFQKHGNLKTKIFISDKHVSNQCNHQLNLHLSAGIPNRSNY